MMAKRIVLAAVFVMSASLASAQDAGALKTIKIGVLNDMSGQIKDVAGPGSVVAAELAVQDYSNLLPNVKIEVIQADHQNNVDVAASVARRWLDTEHVDAIADVPFSPAALAVNEIVRNSPRGVALFSGAGTADITGSRCSPRTVQWTLDNWAIAHSTAKAVYQTGLKKWFFLVADFAFGHALEAEGKAEILASGGQIVGSVRVPYGQSDFSSFLLKAQSSDADVIGLANSTADTVNSIKQAREFGIDGSGKKIVALSMLISDLDAVGLQDGQGLYLTEPFYWDLNAGTRAFSARFAERMNGRPPGSVQAGVYGVVAHYLKAVAAIQSTDGGKVVAKMKEMPTDDPLFGAGRIRPDGRKIHNMYLFQAKAPGESKGRWDYYKLVRTIPAEEAFRPLKDGGCSLVDAK